jgi:hypothetical protein
LGGTSRGLASVGEKASAKGKEGTGKVALASTSGAGVKGFIASQGTTGDLRQGIIGTCDDIGNGVQLDRSYGKDDKRAFCRTGTDRIVNIYADGIPYLLPYGPLSARPTGAAEVSLPSGKSAATDDGQGKGDAGGDGIRYRSKPWGLVNRNAKGVPGLAQSNRIEGIKGGGCEKGVAVYPAQATAQRAGVIGFFSG